MRRRQVALLRMAFRGKTRAIGAYAVPRIRLTEFTVKNAKPVASQYTLWDSALPNFGVRVSPGGTKNFVVMLGERRERISVGRYPIISIADARDKARRLMAERVLGLNKPKTIKFAEAYDLFKTHHCCNLRPRTAAVYRQRIERHFLPKLGHKRLNDVTFEMVIEITDKLLKRPGEQWHALATVRTFFRWCVRRRYIPHSPIEGLQIPQSNERTRVLSDDELVAVWRAAEQIGYPFGTIVHLLVLTGQRRGEIAKLERGFINPKERTITLPATLTKNGRVHTFPYGDMLAGILESIPRFNSTNYLFPAQGHHERAYSGFSKGKTSINALAPVAPWGLHDLRRTYATNLAALRTPPHIIEKLLNHVTGQISGVAAIYNRFQYQDEMREAVMKWEVKLAALLGQASSLPTAA